MCPVQKHATRKQILMNNPHEHILCSNTGVPNIPNLVSKIHPHYKYIESVASIEHRQINDLFLARLRREQASDPWINEIKHSLQYNDNTHPLTQNG